MRQLVLPGEKIKDGEFYSDCTYVENGKTYATVLGFVENGRFTPLLGSYKPRKGDDVIGVVVDIKGTAGYLVDINLPTFAFLPAMLVHVPLKLGDIISAKVGDVMSGGEIVLSDPHKLMRGRLIDFEVKRIPRLIGKKRSMLETLMKGTHNKIFVGMNGYVYIVGKNIPMAIKLIKIIEKKAHTRGLTHYIEELIKKEGGNDE